MKFQLLLIPFLFIFLFQSTISVAQSDSLVLNNQAELIVKENGKYLYSNQTFEFEELRTYY